jgi:fused signal recognition particle receptor
MIDFLNKWKTGLDRTRKITFGRIANLFGTSQITIDTWNELERLLIQADTGVETTRSIIESLQQHVKLQGLTESEELQSRLRSELLNRLDLPVSLNFDQINPVVILLAGVNGSGKTTTVAKLGKLFSLQNKKVLLAAADTFRAAAVDQLQVWGERLNLTVVTGQPNADPGSVAFASVQACIARNFDMVIIDTAGRLHTRNNLMEELKKICRVVGKALPGAPHAVWLILDATTGQNALHQARAFKEAINVNGVILAKFDTSAKGGMAFAIQKELSLPIVYVGLGEKTDDLQPFNREAFVDALLFNR